MTGHKSVFSRLIDGEEMDAEKFIHLLESKIDIVHQKLASRSAEQLEIDAFDLQLASPSIHIELHYCFLSVLC